MREAVHQHFRVSLDDHEQVIEIVSYAAGKLSHRLHLLCLTQLICEMFTIGDVERYADDSDQFPFVALQRLHVRFQNTI